MLFGHTVSLGLPRGEVSEHTSPTFVLSLAGYRVSEYQVFPLTSAPWLSPACVFIPRPFPNLEESLSNYTLCFRIRG